MLLGVVRFVRLMHRGGDAVEAGQTQGATKQVDKGDDPSGLVKVLQHDLVHQERRSQAEGNDIGQRVKLPAKGALVSAEARHAAVEEVKNAGAKDEGECGVVGMDRGFATVVEQGPLDDLEHGGKATEEVPRRHEVRQEVDLRLVIAHGVGKTVSGLGCRLLGQNAKGK